jgi:hypothetical protein
MPQDKRVAGKDHLPVPGGSPEPVGDLCPEGRLLLLPVGEVAGFARRPARSADTEDLSVSLRLEGRWCGGGRVLNLCAGGLLLESSSELDVAQTVGFELCGPNFRYVGVAAVAHREVGSVGLRFVTWEGDRVEGAVRALVAARLRTAAASPGCRQAGRGVHAREAREHQRAAVSGLSAVIEGSPVAPAGRYRVLDVGEHGILIDGLRRPVGARISFVLAGRGIDHAGSGRVAHRRGRSAGVAVDHWCGAPEAIRALVSDERELGPRAQAYISDWS